MERREPPPHHVMLVLSSALPLTQISFSFFSMSDKNISGSSGRPRTPGPFSASFTTSPSLPHKACERSVRRASKSPCRRLRRHFASVTRSGPRGENNADNETVQGQRLRENKDEDHTNKELCRAENDSVSVHCHSLTHICMYICILKCIRIYVFHLEAERVAGSQRQERWTGVNNEKRKQVVNLSKLRTLGCCAFARTPESPTTPIAIPGKREGAVM